MTWIADFFGAAYIRAIGAGLLVIMVGAAGWRVTTWRDGYHRARRAETALASSSASLRVCLDREAVAQQALRQAERAARVRADHDRATAERIERDLQTQLAAADGRARDLARRLLDATRAAGACPGAVSASAGASAGAARAAGESGRDGAIADAAGDVMAACAADSMRLAGWQEWWGGVSRD